MVQKTTKKVYKKLPKKWLKKWHAAIQVVSEKSQKSARISV